MLFQRLNEFPDVVFGDISDYCEFLADFVDDGGLARSRLKKAKDLRADEVEVEHLALLDIQDNGAILAVRAANTF